MKRFLTPIIRPIIASSFGWWISKYFIRAAEWLRYERSKLEHEKAEIFLSVYFEKKIVEHGFFKGLKYPALSSAGSSLFPKLSGSYESELTVIFENLMCNDYATIIDIGCAEGFYAVGLAIKFPNAEVIAFDKDSAARKLCAQMAKVNKMKLNILEGCTADFFEQIDQNKRHLVICDCEGYEEELFIESNIKYLSKTDLIIELHPMYSPHVKKTLFGLFRDTHGITYLSSYDNARKISDLPTVYQNFSPLEKIKIVEEGRVFSMDWMICDARKAVT